MKYLNYFIKVSSVQIRCLLNISFSMKLNVRHASVRSVNDIRDVKHFFLYVNEAKIFISANKTTKFHSFCCILIETNTKIVSFYLFPFYLLKR